MQDLAKGKFYHNNMRLTKARECTKLFIGSQYMVGFVP